MRIAALVALALAAACGNDAASRIDASTGDGDGGGDVDMMIDADPSVRGPVTVRLVDKNGAALPDLHVIFIDTDQTVTVLMTDATGTAVGSVYPGASVTALKVRDSGSIVATALTTVRDLNPNDTITLITAGPTVSTLADPFTQRVVPLPSIDIATAEKAGSNGRFTTITPHGLATNDRVIINGVLDSGYDGTYTVTNVVDATTFTGQPIANGLNPSTGGTASKATPFTLTYPAYTGATTYELRSSCGGTDLGNVTTAQVLLNAACVKSPMDLIVFAKTSSTTEAAWAAMSNVTITSGATINITDTWHAMSTLTATLSNPTTRVTDVTVNRYAPYLRGAAQVNANAQTTGTPLTLMLDTSTAAGTAWMRTNLRCPAGSSNDCITSTMGVAQQFITQRVDGTATTYMLDVGANLLPWVNAAYTPSTTTIDVTVTGTGSIDLFEANLKYARVAGTIQHVFTWRLFGPTPGSVTFPALPTTLPNDPTVRPTDAQSGFNVFLCESDAIGGYRDAIKNVYEALGTCDGSPLSTTKSFGGTLNRLSQWN